MKSEERKYIQLGIYDEGEIVMTSKPEDVFMDKVVDTFAFIKKINGSPRGAGMCGLKYYSTACVDYDLGRITQLSTWQAIVENGFADCLKEKDDNALRFALKSVHPIGTEVFDLLYEAYPDTELVDMLWQCNRLSAAKWVLEHGADKDYDGLKETMKVLVCEHIQDRYEGREIFEYAYQCDPDEY